MVKRFRINNLTDESSYLATKLDDARDDTDRSALQEAMRSNEVITMGMIIVEPLPTSQGSNVTRSKARGMLYDFGSQGDDCVIFSLAEWQAIDAAVIETEDINAELVEVLDGLLSHLWDNHKRNVKEDYSLMVAEVAAQEALEKAKAVCSD